MTAPTYFAVEYAINPWMDPDVRRHNVALNQWATLRETYKELGHTVELVEPVPGLPDMVYAANGGCWSTARPSSPGSPPAARRRGGGVR